MHSSLGEDYNSTIIIIRIIIINKSIIKKVQMNIIRKIIIHLIITITTKVIIIRITIIHKIIRIKVFNKIVLKITNNYRNKSNKNSKSN